MTSSTASIEKGSPWVVLFGGPKREQILRELVVAGVEIVRVIVPESKDSRLDKSCTDFRSWGLDVTRATRAAFADELRPWRPLPLLSIGFPYLLDSDTLSRHALCINVHPTLLPAYRGPHSGAYIIINGEDASGSTVHLMDAGMDTGAVVAQSYVPLNVFDTVRSMQRKVYAAEPALVLGAIRALEARTTVTQQDHSQATSYPRRRTQSDSEIDPTLPLIDLWNAIRACDPVDYPAFFWVKDQKVCVRLWRPDKQTDESDMI